MNIKLSIYAFLLMFSINCLAQNDYLSFRSGVTASTLIGGDVDGSVNLKPGFHAGFTVNDQISGNFYLRISILYNRLGFSNDILGIDTKTNFHFGQLPISFKYYLNESLSVYAGAQIDALLEVNAKINDDRENVTDFYQNGSYGFNAGLSYDLSDWVIDLNYYYAGNDLLKGVKLSWRVTSIELSLGYKIINN